jgi:glycosyltransferase involved in cell wall biosynthesis
MIFSKKSTSYLFKKTNFLWISDTQPFDVFLHKASLLNIVEQLAEMDHKVTLIASRSRTKPTTIVSRLNAIFFPLRFVPVVSPIIYAGVVFFFLPFFIAFSNPDYVILEYDISIIPSLPSFLISRVKKVKFVLDVRSIPVELGGGSRDFLHLLKFSTSILIGKKLFDGITTLTPLMKEEISNQFTLKPSKIGVWTSGVSPSLFNSQNRKFESENLKKMLGLTGKFVVFYHGIFTATRGLQETIDAIEIVSKKNPQIVFFLLGTGPIVTALKQIISEKNLQQNVIIHDSVEHSAVPKYIALCDVGIVPLPYNPYWRFQNPLKLLEYLAMEKVVILTDIPAHRAVIGESPCGIYIKSISPQEIAKAIGIAYLNRENLGEMGKIGREIIDREYVWKKVAIDLEKYLQSIDQFS